MSSNIPPETPDVPATVTGDRIPVNGRFIGLIAMTFIAGLPFGVAVGWAMDGQTVPAIIFGALAVVVAWRLSWQPGRTSVLRRRPRNNVA